MVYVGFGYLMTFLKRYGYGAVGYTLLLSAIVLQWAVLMRGIWQVRQAKVLLDVERCVSPPKFDSHRSLYQSDWESYRRALVYHYSALCTLKTRGYQ